MRPASPETTESERLLMGKYLDGPEAGNVVAVYRQHIREHAFICGQTGSGKTSIGLISLLMQLARPYKKPCRDRLTNQLLRDRDGRPLFEDCTRSMELWAQHRPPIIVFDMKGDPLLFNTARSEAERNGYKFRHFSIDGNKSSYYFNPLASLQPRPPTEFCELLLNALDLEHGPGYGEGYFSAQHRAALLRAITTLKKEGIHVRDWAHLLELIRKSKKKKDGLEKSVRDATELVTVIYALTFFTQMLSGEKADRSQTDRDRITIHMPQVLAEREMAYFWLPTAEYSQGVREVGKLALYALVSAARTLAEAGRKPEAYVFIDEAQHLAGRNFEKPLTQCRSFGLSLVMASQYLDAFNFSKFDLRPVIKNCTRLKRYFSISSAREFDEMQRLSGERIEVLRTQTETETSRIGLFGDYEYSRSTARAERESRTPRLESDMARLVNNDQNSSLLCIEREGARGENAGVPRLITSQWPITWAEMTRRESFAARPWPLEPNTPEVTDSKVRRESVRKRLAVFGPEDTDDSEDVDASTASTASTPDIGDLFDNIAEGGYDRDVQDVLKDAAARQRKKRPRKKKGGRDGAKKTQDS